MIEKALIEIINSDYFKENFVKECAYFYINKKLSDEILSEDDNEFYDIDSEIMKNIEKRSIEVSKEILTESIKRLLKNDYSMQELFKTSIAPAFNKLLEKTLYDFK